MKDARDRELAAELESHLQMHIDDNIRAGMSPQDARRVAVMKLGGLDQTKEAYRDRSTIPFLESVVQDLRFTLRQLRKNPAFTVTATTMVALAREFPTRAPRSVNRSNVSVARGVTLRNALYDQIVKVVIKITDLNSFRIS